MTQDVLDRTLLLFSEKPIRTGDLIGKAHAAGLEDRAAWDAIQQLERAGLVRAVTVPHKKNKKISVCAWIRSNTP